LADRLMAAYDAARTLAPIFGLRFL